MYRSLQNLNTNKQHIYTREIEMSKILRFGLLLLLSLIQVKFETILTFQNNELMVNFENLKLTFFRKGICIFQRFSTFI